MLNLQPSPEEFRQLAAPFLARHGFGPETELTVLRGGANNRVYRVDDGRRQAALKKYFRNPNDSRDRFRAEQAFYEFLWHQGIRRTPQPLGWESEQRLGLLSFVIGEKPAPAAVNRRAVEQAAQFVIELNSFTVAPEGIPPASESCFSVAEHLQCVQRRVGRLDQLEMLTELDQQAAAFVQNELTPAWTRVREAIQTAGETDLQRVLKPAERCLSPSDFGFHNCLVIENNQLRFFDFEYAGWDDPAKLVCDFFCQPSLPVELEHWDRFVEAIGGRLAANDFAARARLLLPAYRIKWCCIMLNDFVRSDQARREFALGDAAAERKKTQLTKARAALAEVAPSGSGGSAGTGRL